MTKEWEKLREELDQAIIESRMRWELSGITMGYSAAREIMRRIENDAAVESLLAAGY